jgi:hypothetical protein
MNTMNMPGFTAEISVYKTNSTYQSVATQSYSNGGQGVISQIRAGGLGFDLGGRNSFWCRIGCSVARGACTEGKDICDQAEYWCNLSCRAETKAL